MEITKRSPEDFIKTLPDGQRENIATLNQAIKKVLPGVKGVMWEGKFWGGTEQKIIAYGDMTCLNSKKEEVAWFIIGLAQQKNYITVYINAFENKRYLTQDYQGKLGKAKVGNSTITFKKLEDIDLEVLMELLKKGYKMMVNQNA